MRTIIVSDLHLGNGGPYDVFAGESALPELLGRYESEPVRLIVNGDAIDFLMNDDPLALAEERAVQQSRAIAEHGATKSILHAFGRILARGGEVIVRAGNHDVELAYDRVQAVFREALGQPAEVAARLSFQLGNRPGFVEVGGVTMLVTHGEHADPWNQVDYDHLLRDKSEFTYAPGSRLVKRFLNPLTKRHGMRFVNLLKPDFQGGALTALAVSPSIMKLVFQDASADIAWQLFKKASTAPTFAPAGADEPEDFGLAERFEEVGLTEEERGALEQMLGEEMVSFAGDEESSGLGSARLKLVRAGLKLYAGVQKRASGRAAEEYFSLEPEAAEWRDAQRLAKKYDVRAVIEGHTHAARWRQEAGVVYANTGTWSYLMQMPPCEADLGVWADYFSELQRNPGLVAAGFKKVKLIGRFTAVVAEPVSGGGAALKLVELGQRGPETMGETTVR